MNEFCVDVELIGGTAICEGNIEGGHIGRYRIGAGYIGGGHIEYEFFEAIHFFGLFIEIIFIGGMIMEFISGILYLVFDFNLFL